MSEMVYENEQDMCKVFVSGLPVRLNRSQIVEFFQKFGTVVHCKVKKNSKTGRIFGYAHLTFEDPEVAIGLIGKPIEFCGRICECKPLIRKDNLESHKEQQQRLKLEVTNIDQRATNQDLMEAFLMIFPISYAYVVKENPSTRMNRGFGFVVFKNGKDLQAFISCKHRVKVLGKAVEWYSGSSESKIDLLSSQTNQKRWQDNSHSDIDHFQKKERTHFLINVCEDSESRVEREIQISKSISSTLAQNSPHMAVLQPKNEQIFSQKVSTFYCQKSVYENSENLLDDENLYLMGLVQNSLLRRYNGYLNGERESKGSEVTESEWYKGPEVGSSKVPKGSKKNLSKAIINQSYSSTLGPNSWGTRAEGASFHSLEDENLRFNLTSEASKATFMNLYDLNSLKRLRSSRELEAPSETKGNSENQSHQTSWSLWKSGIASNPSSLKSRGIKRNDM